MLSAIYLYDAKRKYKNDDKDFQFEFTCLMNCFIISCTFTTNVLPQNTCSCVEKRFENCSW